MKNQIAYLIDPDAGSISEILAEEGIDWINKAIGSDCFTGGYSQLPNMPSLFIDDEGLYKPELHFFHYKGAYEPFCGKAIAMDVDSRGRSVTPKMSIEEFAKNIAFVFPIQINGKMRFIDARLQVKIKKLARPIKTT